MSRYIVFSENDQRWLSPALITRFRFRAAQMIHELENFEGTRTKLRRLK